MKFDHEKLDVYRVSLEFVGWAFVLCKGLSGLNRHPRDQLLRASQLSEMIEKPRSDWESMGNVLTTNRTS